MNLPLLVRGVGVMLSVIFLTGLVRGQVAELTNVTVKATEVINLWPGAAPGEKEKLGPEHVIPDRPRPFDQLVDVSVPTLAVFPAPAATRNGTAMLVIPGGGLERLAIEHEGYEVAEWLNEQGIAAFVLKYRVPPRDPQQRWKVGLQDAQRAMGLIRSRASEWGVDKNAVGSMGFSAGGEINVLLSVNSGGRDYPPVDAADAQSCRPDFNVVLYGGGFADVAGNQMRADIGSRLGAGTPPMFIAHAFDDQALSSVILMNALKRANVRSELHVFAAGAHGFGVRDSGLTIGAWRELCLNWLRWQGYLDSTAVRAYVRTSALAEKSGAALPRFSVTNPSSKLADAFAVQHRFVRETIASGDEVVGYVGASFAIPFQAVEYAPAVIHGVIFKRGRITAATGTSIRADERRPILIETEIGYVIGVDIGSKLRVPRQAMTAVESLVPVIALPQDIRRRMGGTATDVDAVAANLGSGGFIVGLPIAPKRVKDVNALGVVLERDGAVVHTAKVADVNGGQAANLMALINQIIEQGNVIHRGDVITSGSLGGSHAGAKGAYRADFGELGLVEFRIE